MTNSTATKLPTVCRETGDYIALEKAYGANNYKPLDVVLERGEGVWVWDVDGNRYLDCLAAYSAVNQGHAHPRILKAMVEQASKLPLTSRAFRNTQLPQLARELCDLLGFARMLPMNSGAEAVETALKAARKWAYAVKGVPAGQANIIVCDGNFHGRTISIVSFSTEELYRAAFSPFTPGFTVIPYGDAEALEAAITPETAAFLVEPIQGEAGVNIPPAGYLQKAKAICEKHKVLLISDEIQTGLGRTGFLMDCMADGVHPDMAIIGKALSGGFYPVSAVVAQAGILELFTPGEHGSTFGGNPLGCAVARAALKVLMDEKLIERARTQGAYLMEKLSHVKSPHVKEIRGRGLMVGVDLHPSAGGARRFCEMLQTRGILCKETHDHVIRLAPPLVIENADLDFLVSNLAEVLG